MAKILDTLASKTLSPISAKGSDMSWEQDRGWEMLNLGGTSGDSFVTFEDFVRNGFRKNPVVAACIREIVTSLSEAPIRGYSKDSTGKYTLLPNHKAEQLFYHPNNRDSYVSFMEKTGQHFLLGGNTMWWKKRGGNRRVERLIPIRPDQMVGVTVTGPEQEPVLWHVMWDRSRQHADQIEAADIVHIPDIDPLNDIFGMPRLLSAALEMSSDNEASRYVSEVLQNHGTPGVVVSIDRQRVNETILAEAEERWESKFGPGRGRGRVAFVPGATHIKDIGFNLRDLEFPSLRALTREGICTVFGVDPALIAISSATKSSSMSGSEATEIRRKFWEQTMIPLMRRFEAAMNSHLAPDFGSNVYLKFDLSEVTALREARTEEIDRMTKMAMAGAFSQEEIREEGGFDPHPTKGALVVVPQNLALLRAGNEEEGDIKLPKKTTPEDNSKMQSKGTKEFRSGQMFSVLGFPLRGDNRKSVAFSHFDSFTRGEEFLYKEASLTLLDRERRESISMAQRMLRDSEGKSLESKEVTEDDLERLLAELGLYYEAREGTWTIEIGRLHEDTASKVSASMLGGLGVATFDLATFIGEVMDERREKVSSIPADTFRAIQDSLWQGIEQGENARQLTARVRDVFDEGYARTDENGKRIQVRGVQDRAELIAQTESVAMVNGAALATVKASEIADIFHKIWINQGDEKVRDTHVEEMDGQPENGIPVNEPFPVTGVDYPQEPNCRCSIGFVVP